MAVATLSSIVSQAFVAFHRAGFTLAQGLIFSLLKLILAAEFASAFKVFGIFASWGIAAAVGLGLSLLVFLPQLLPGYRPLPCLRLRLSPASSPQPPNPDPRRAYTFSLRQLHEQHPLEPSHLALALDGLTCPNR